MNGRVSIVGSINLDQVVRIARWPEPGETVMGDFVGHFPGGKGFNQAVAAHRAGATVTFCGCVGDDANGEFLRAAMARAGLENSRVATSRQHPTAIAQIAALPSGENSIVVMTGANHAIEPAEAIAALQGAAVTLLQLEIDPKTALKTLVAARGAGIMTVLNAAPAQSAPRELLALADVLVINETELASLGGLDPILANGTRDVVLTLGARGASWVNAGGKRLNVPAFTVEVIDTTGAGDAFCGALAASLAMGLGPERAMLRASAAGAITASALGAQTETLNSAAIERVIETGMVA